MGPLIGLVISAIPSIIKAAPDIIKAVGVGKVKNVVQDEATGTVAIVGKPWWMSKAMVGAVLIVGAAGARWLGYDLGSENVDGIVELIGGVLVLIGRAKAVK
jgi:uncharacterized membrane protein